MNKYRFWGLIAALSTLLTVFGAWAKLTHKSYADTTLTTGLILFGITQAVYHYLKFIALKSKKDQQN